MLFISMVHGQAQISDDEIYLLNKYIKGVLWKVPKRLSYIEYARWLKVNNVSNINFHKRHSYEAQVSKFLYDIN